MSEQIPTPKPQEGVFLPVKKALTQEPQSPVLAPAYLAEMGLVGLAKPYLTGIDSTDPGQRAILRKCKHSQSDQIGNLLNTPIRVVNWYIAPVPIVDEASGERKIYPMTVLVTEDGGLVGSGSQGIAQCVFDYATTERQAPWNPPVVMTPKVRKLANGRQWYYMEIEDDKPAAVKPAAGKKTG